MKTHDRNGSLPDGRAIVIQMGARRNYAVPAALAAAGRLEALYTDLAGSRRLGKLAKLGAKLPFPAGIRNQLASLAKRQPPDLVAPLTQTFDGVAARYEIEMRRANDAQARIEARRRFNRRWSQAMLAKGFGDATHIYAMMSGQTLEGEDFLLQAKAAGLKIVVDVTIALSTERIIASEYAAHPGWGAPPDTYLGATGQDNPTYRRMIDLADRLLCASEFVASDLIDNWGADPAKVRVEPYSLQPIWLEVENDPVPGRVLFTGSADLRKGIHHFAQAAQILQQRGHKFEFIVVGNVEREVREHRDTAALQFAGRLSRSAMADAYSSADVVVLPTLAEGSAGVTYEAMACAIPVVTTREAGSLVEDGEHGFIVPSGDSEALANAIEGIVTDRVARQKMGMAARHKMQNMAWDGYSERLIRAVFADM